jgi:hypothetical protein
MSESQRKRASTETMPRIVAVSGSIHDVPYGAKPKRGPFEWFLIALFFVLLGFAIIAVIGLVGAVI